MDGGREKEGLKGRGGTPPDKCTDGVRSNTKKCKPDTVTEFPPVPGLLIGVRWEATGASKVKKLNLMYVPIWPATVMRYSCVR